MKTRTRTRQAVRQPIHPLNAPEMPFPGPDFLEMAEHLGDNSQVEQTGKKKTDQRLKRVGDQLKELYRRCLYSPGDFGIRCATNGRGTEHTTLRVIGGHLWESLNHAHGPQPAEVMVVGKMLGEKEIQLRRHMCGPTGEFLQSCLADLGCLADEWGQWYVTNLLKTHHPQGLDKRDLVARWLDDWKPLIHQELRLVKPKYLLFLGADASKAILGKHANVANMEGRLEELTYPVAYNRRGEPTRWHTTLAMTIYHPAAVLAAEELTDRFMNQLSRFVQLTRGLRWDKEEEGLDQRVISTLEDLEALKHEINADIDRNLLGMDAEWHGRHPENEGSYLRSVQVAWRDKTAAYIELYREDGEPNFEGEDWDRAIQLINEICDGKIIVGHYFEADLEWLVAYGIDLREAFLPPKNWQQYRRLLRTGGNGRTLGYDTAYAAHAINETDEFALTVQALRHTTAPRYDTEVAAEVTRYCAEHGLKKEELEGYGFIPTSILAPYGAYDADCPRRIAIKQIFELLDADRFGNNCWPGFYRKMRMHAPILEMNCYGVMADRRRIDEQTAVYLEARARLAETVRTWAKWPSFNVNSVFDVREFLFGEELAFRETEPQRRRPPGAKSLKLQPVFSTAARPMLWDEVVERGLVGEHKPSTNKLALSILAQEAQKVTREVKNKRGQLVTKDLDLSQYVTWIRDYRFVGQVLKSVLREPKRPAGEKAAEYIRRPDGYWEYAAGLPASICDDGRVRTHVYPTKETSRWSTARPPLQNLGKNRERDYKRILDDLYLGPIRSVLRASPGHLLIEADYRGAELQMMAILSGDPQMLDDVRRNNLPEEHKDYLDIHSMMTALAFGLDCDWTKAGLESLKQDHLRHVTKSVVFGIAYGRGAKAIALAAKEEKIWISEEQAQQIIDTVYARWPRLKPFFAECGEMALSKGYLLNWRKRPRRFPHLWDPKKAGDVERQAMNYPIQGGVAELLEDAVWNLYHYRFEHGDYAAGKWYHLALSVHDAVLVEAPYEAVPWVVNEVLPTCLVDNAPMYPRNIRGEKLDRGPYRLGIEVELFERWGEKLKKEHLAQFGLVNRNGQLALAN